jgi:hypothetical protein
MALAAGDHLIVDDVGTLTAADFISGKATHASECDYIITGAEAT